VSKECLRCNPVTVVTEGFVEAINIYPSDAFLCRGEIGATARVVMKNGHKQEVALSLDAAKRIRDRLSVDPIKVRVTVEISE